MKKWLWSLGVACLAACGVAQAQGQPEKVKLAIATTNPVISYYPFEIALAKGYFKDEGLEVERSIFAGGSQTTAALVGGSADMTVSAYSNTLTMAAKGQALQAVVLMIKYPAFVLGVTKKSIAKYKTPKDLAGMVIGVTAPGSSTNYILNSFARRNGVDPKSYSVIGVGAQATAAAAAREGQIDALVGLDPVVTMLGDAGEFKVLADLRTGAGTLAAVGAETYPEGSLIAAADFIKKNPNTVQAVVNAMLRAEKFLASASAEQIADALPKNYQVGARAQFLSAIEHTRTVYATDGRYDAKGVEAVLDVYAGSDPEFAEARKKINVQNTYTNRFVEAAVVKKP